MYLISTKSIEGQKTTHYCFEYGKPRQLLLMMPAQAY